jgi:hypothetical protein
MLESGLGVKEQNSASCRIRDSERESVDEVVA